MTTVPSRSVTGIYVFLGGGILRPSSLLLFLVNLPEYTYHDVVYKFH